MKLIRDFSIDKTSISGDGEKRIFTLLGDNNAVFSLEIRNEDNHYYNFSTESFSATRARLDRKTIKNGSYTGYIKFPAISDDDHYDIYVFAEPHHNTKHVAYREVRFDDGTIDINSSYGSNSSLMMKKIYQYTNLTLTMSAISPNSTVGISVTTDTFLLNRDKTEKTLGFSVTVTGSSNKSLSIIRQPLDSDITTSTSRTIDDEVLIDYETGSTFYRWEINNIVGLDKGMIPIGTNITSGSFISDYVDTVSYTTVTEREGEAPEEELGDDEKEESGGPTGIDEEVSQLETTFVRVKLPALDGRGFPKVYTNGVLTSQEGKVIFSKKQAAALEDDTITIYAYGNRDIKTMTGGFDYEISNLAVALNATTSTTTTAAVNSSTTIPVAEQLGIIANTSTMSGIGVAAGAIDPTVTAKAADNGAGNLTVDVAQTLENGQTLTFPGANQSVVITGNIKINNAGTSSTTLYFDVENLLDIG